MYTAMSLWAPVPCETAGFRVIRVNIRAPRPWFSTSQRVQHTWTSSHGGSHTVEDRFSVTVEIGISETSSIAHSFKSDRRALLSTFHIEKCRTLRQKQLMCGAYMINLSFLPTSTKHVVHPQNLEARPTSQPKKTWNDSSNFQLPLSKTANTLLVGIVPVRRWWITTVSK